MMSSVRPHRTLPPCLRSPSSSSLGVLSRFNPWETCPGSSVMCSLNVYLGCSYDCHYCYARSYMRRFIPEFEKARPKKDFLRRLRTSIRRFSKSLRIPVSISNSTDPYQPIEAIYGHTRYSLIELGSRGFPILLITKSTMFIRDLDLLRKLNLVLSVTVTGIDHRRVSLLEPAAPPPETRLKALKMASREGVKVVVRIDPLIPGWNAEERELDLLFGKLSGIKALQVVSSTVKLRRDFTSRLRGLIRAESGWRAEVLREILNQLGRFKIRHRGYLVASLKERMEILRVVKDLSEKHGLTYSFCMEPLDYPAPTCNGLHLLDGWDEIVEELKRSYEAMLFSSRRDYFERMLENLNAFSRKGP